MSNKLKKGSTPDNSHLPEPTAVGKRYIRMSEVVWAIQMDRNFAINLLEGVERGIRGDYLVKGGHGELIAVPQHVFEVNYLAQSVHPDDHEPQYERIDIGEPGEVKTEGRICRKCGFMQAKEIRWAPAGWRPLDKLDAA